MQLMPVTGVTMLANYPQESHCAKARRPPPRSPVRPSAVSSRRARAQRVHPWRLPWRPHAYRAALRVSPASKFSERYLSFPPNFTTFGHFLQPTTTWIVLTKPSSALLCKKILAPSKVGLNRKRSDFLDLPNGLWQPLAGLPWRQEGNTFGLFWDIVWPPATFLSTWKTTSLPGPPTCTTPETTFLPTPHYEHLSNA